MARILVNFTSPYPNKLTGISIYAWRIVEALHRHGRHDYVISTNWDVDAIPQRIRDLGMPIVHRKVPINETLAQVVNTVTLPRLMRKVGASLIFHTQPAAMLGRMGRSVTVLHDLYRESHSHLFDAKQVVQWRQVTSRGLRRSGRLIAVSHATRDAAVRFYPTVADRISVVHEASPIDHLPDDILPQEEPAWTFCLMVANITRNKNIELLYQSLTLLAQDGFRPKVMLIGRDDIGLLPSLSQRYPDADIELGGSHSEESLIGLYRAASAYINTSTVEGFCLPILEAQTLGLPVVCTDIPVLREVAGEGAAFIDPQDPRSLAGVIRALMEQSEMRADLRHKGRLNASRFSWKKAAEETEAVFDSLLAERV